MPRLAGARSCKAVTPAWHHRKRNFAPSISEHRGRSSRSGDDWRTQHWYRPFSMNPPNPNEESQGPTSIAGTRGSSIGSFFNRRHGGADTGLLHSPPTQPEADNLFRPSQDRSSSSACPILGWTGPFGPCNARGAWFPTPSSESCFGRASFRLSGHGKDSI